MTYWIYSMGLPVPVRDDQLLIKRNIQPLQALAKNHQITDTDTDKQLIQPNIEKDNSLSAQRGAISSAYKNNSQNDRRLVVSASEIMSSPVVTLPKDISFHAAWRKFQDYRFRHFPIVNEDKQLIGIISDRDMLASSEIVENRRELINTDLSITEIMVSTVLTASGDTSIHEICQVMFTQHIGALPIVNEDQLLLGLITRSDILRTVIKNKAMEFWI
jgi:acetoin utilization protein AcuB